ncbi:MAG TPA: carbon-nitrogen hydrolase family protein [Pseudomonadales bacterium]
MNQGHRLTRVGVVQLCATPDVTANMIAVERLVPQACDAGAEVVLLPEAFAFLGPEKAKRGILERLPDAPSAPGGPILEQCRSMAARLGCHLILGGFHEDAGDPDKSYNTCVHLSPGGELLARYRKVHLFDVALADGTQLRESARTLAGHDLVTTDMPFGKLGLSICYDLRFPYLYQSLVDAGAVAMTVPSAFTKTTGAAHWHVLLRARAIECQSYVIAPAQHGHNWGKRFSYGHSLIVDPWGDIVAECRDGDGVAVADIDPERVRRVREELPSLTHRRLLE